MSGVNEEKKCIKCGEGKPLKEFSKSSRCKNGRRGTCKSCDNLRRRHPDPTKRKYQAKVIDGKKRCKECGEEKLLSEFNRNAEGVGGRQNICRVCLNLQRRHPDPAKRYHRVEITEGTTRCVECKEIKLVEDFVEDKRRREGITNICKTCRSDKTRSRIEIFNKQAVLEMGGKCEICGLETEWYEVYHFHHNDPTQKDFQVAKMLYMDWESVALELRKCMLLCCECHNNLTQQISRSRLNRPRYSRYRDSVRDSRKMDLIDYLGGRCQICGRVHNDLPKYEFHHVNRSTKAFSIGSNILTSLDILYKEADKCCLLCGNCHCSVTYGRYDHVTLIPGPHVRTVAKLD
jgi:hypothetical protein